MITLEVTQKTMRTSMEIITLVLWCQEQKKGKDSRVSCSYKNESREYTLQEEANHSLMCLFHQKLMQIIVSSEEVYKERKGRKFIKVINVLLSEGCFTQYKPLTCDFKIAEVKDIMRKV